MVPIAVRLKTIAILKDWLPLPVAVALASSPLSAQVENGEAKSVRVVRIETPPVLDGRLDDPAWAQAVAVDDLHEVYPDEYESPSRDTVVYVVYDDDALYVGARMYEEPGETNALILRQGAPVADDRFGLMLDPFNNARSGYIFELNPLSVRDDALFQNTTEENWNWTGIWHGRSHMDEDGWTAEFRIPFKTVSFDPENDTWGINFSRYRTRHNEQIGWSSNNRSQNPSNFGEAVGFEGLSQGLGLDIVPGIVLSSRKNILVDTSSDEFDPSLDAFYRISPAVTAAITVNTDFSGTDVDEIQVNLSRFGLFYPEQRAFFLRDTDIFEFGRLGGSGLFYNPSAIEVVERENGRPFFSRRIGLNDTGEEVGIDYGGKMTGRIGRWDFGLLSIQQDRFQEIDKTNLFVGRAAVGILEESALGVILTNGHPTENLDNTLLGFDFRYFNTRLANGRTVEAAAWYQQSETEGMAGDDAAFGFSVNMPNTEFWRGALSVKELQENFNPALGFVHRLGIRDATLELGYTHRLDDGFIRSVFSGVDVQRIERLAGGVESEQFTFRFLEMESDGGDQLRANATSRRESVVDAFELHDGIAVPVGEYETREYGVEFTSAYQRRLSTSLEFSGGGFFGGDIQSWSLNGLWRPTSRYEFGLGTEVNHVDLTQGSFSTRVVSLTGDIAFSSTWSWENFIQYDNVSDTVGWNSILRWFPEEGREMLIVINYGAEDFDESGRFNTAVTDYTFRINHTFRF